MTEMWLYNTHVFNPSHVSDFSCSEQENLRGISMTKIKLMEMISYVDTSDQDKYIDIRSGVAAIK